MDEWKSDWLAEDENEYIDGYEISVQNESFNLDENTAYSPILSRDSIESDDDERNDKNDTTLVKPTFKSISQAKKRLQAFSAMKNLKKNKEEKTDDVGNSDKNTPKKNKKSLYPDDKAKAVIREIEELKRNEWRQHMMKQELVAVSMKKLELRNAKSRSKSTSPERVKHFKKREIKSRNYRRTDSIGRKSVSPERKSDRKGSSSKPSYPKNWKDYEQQHLTVKKDAQLKTKMFQSPRLQPFELFCRLYNFPTPAPIIESFTFSTCNDDLKEIPFPCVKYTKTTPSLQFNINFQILKESFLTRNQLFSIISRDRRQIIERLMNTHPKPAYNGKKLKTRLWYSKSWKKPGDAECKVLENSVGLSFLQNYSDQEDEENDMDDIVICSSTKANKTKNNVSVSDVRAGTPEKRPESVIEFYETSPVVTSIPIESTEQIIEIDVDDVNEEENMGDFTPKKEINIRHKDELNETKKAIRELEQELERRQTIMLEETEKNKKKRKKKRKKKAEEQESVDSSKEKKKVRKNKIKKELSLDDDISSSEDQKKKKKKKKKLSKDKKENKRLKKKLKTDKGSSKNSKHKKKDESLESSEDVAEKTKKKRKTTDPIPADKHLVVSEMTPKKSKKKIKDKCTKRIKDKERANDNLEVKKQKEKGTGKNKKSKKPDTDWETIEEEVINYELMKKGKTDNSSSSKISANEKLSKGDKDKELDKQVQSKKRPHNESLKYTSKHSEEKKPKMSFDETRDQKKTTIQDSEIIKKNLEIELKIDKKYLERSSNRAKPVSKSKKSIDESSEKQHSNKIVESHTSIARKERHQEVQAKKDKPIIDLFTEEFPLKQDVCQPKKANKSPKTRTPDTNEYRKHWEKDPFPIWESEDDVPRKPKLDNSWESDEEIFEQKDPVSENTNFDLEKPQLQNTSFDLEIPLNIKPFKKREVIVPDMGLKLSEIEGQSSNDEGTKLDKVKVSKVKQLEVTVIKEVEETVLQEKLPSKRNLSKDLVDKVVVTPKRGRWDKKEPVIKFSTPIPDNIDNSKCKTETIIEISSSISSDDNSKILDDKPSDNTSKVLENEYEEFMKAVTSNTSEANKDLKKTLTNSCSISSFSDISDSSLDFKLTSEIPKVDHESKIPKSQSVKKIQLPDSSVAPSLILPTDIPLIPMPSDVKVIADTRPIPVPSPRVRIEKVSKPLVNVKFSPKMTWGLVPTINPPMPRIIDIINLTQDDDGDGKIENEVTSTVSHPSPNKLSTENVAVTDISNLTFNNDIVDINSISLPPPKEPETPNPTTSYQFNTQEQGNNIVINLDSHVEDTSISTNEKSEPIVKDRPFTFTSMVLPTKKLLLDKSKLNLDDSDEEDSKNKSLQKLEDLKKEHLSVAAAMLQPEEKKVEETTIKKDEIQIAPMPVVPEQKDKEQERPKSPHDKSASSKRMHEGGPGSDATPRKPAQSKQPSSPRSKRRDSPPRRRGYSPKRLSPPRRRSPPRRKPPSPVDRKHPSKSNHSPIRKRKRSISPKRRISPPRRSPLRKRSISPRKRGMSPMKRPVSPRRGISPRRRSVSPRKRSISPRRRSVSPRRRCLSPRNKRSISPRKRSISPKRRIKSPIRNSPSPRSKRSVSPRRRSISPRRKLSISPGRHSLRSSLSTRTKSPDMPKSSVSLQKNLERHVFDSNKRKSPLTITSPLERLKRSVADSTISDDLLPQPNANFEEYNHSPISRYYDKSKALDSPKRVPLDVRISRVLGIKEEPKAISTTYNSYNYQQDKVAQQADSEKKRMATVNAYNLMQNFSMPNAKSNFVQVGNMVQIVPTEIPMKTEVLVTKKHPSVAKETAARPPDLVHLEKSTILQVGNMLQIVPTKMAPRAPPPRAPPRQILPPPTLIVKQEIEEVLPEDIPVPQDIPVPPQEIPVLEKQSAETTMKLKTAENRAEREQRRQEREKRRAEKEKKRREREKVRQIKMKQKTEDMIKRALQLEVEGLEEDGELGLKETPAQWPPLPVTPGSKDVGKSILIRGGVCKSSSKSDKRKIVQFADGVKPGEGTSPSGGEELLSPPPPSKTLPKEKRYKKSKLFRKKKVKVKIIKKIPKTEESEDEEDDLPPPSPPPGSPPLHLFPPRVKIHTVNNVRAYMPNLVAVHSTPTQQLFGQAINLLMAPTGTLHQPPPPPPPRQSVPHHVSASTVPPMHHMRTHRSAPTLPGSLGLSHPHPYHY